MISNVNENSLIFNHREEFRRHQNKIESDVQKVAGILEPMTIEMPTTPLSDKNFFEQLPEEVVQKIFSEVTNKIESSFERVVSGLESTRWVSKQFYDLSQKVRKDWISKEAVSLKRLGCNIAQEAIDYAINNKLEAVNLEEFPDIHDGHIKLLIDKCLNISRLFINSDMFFGRCCNIGMLKDLKELEIRSNSVCILDLSKCEKLEEVRINYCGLLSLTLPETAPNLRSVSCSNNPQLKTLTLPKKAPMLEYLNCIYCSKLSSLTLPKKSPVLKNVLCTRCTELSKVALPEKAPQLENCYFTSCVALTLDNVLNSDKYKYLLRF